MIRTGITKFGDFVNSNTKNNETYMFEIKHYAGKYNFLATKCTIYKESKNKYGYLFKVSLTDMANSYRLILKEGRYNQKTMEKFKEKLNYYINSFEDTKPELELADEIYSW